MRFKSRGKHLGELPDVLGSLPRLLEEDAASPTEDLAHAREELASRELLSLSRSAGARRGGRGWTRDELHERP
jgi:hypothetical protein